MRNPVDYADATVLGHLLDDLTRPVAVIAGAWLSVPLPTAVPDAWRWKNRLIESIWRTGGWPDTPTFQDLNDKLSNLGTGEDLKLERVLEAVEDTLPGGSARLVAAVTAGTPNGLHAWIARLLADGSVTHLVTPNFDEFVEQCDTRLSVWSSGFPVPTRSPAQVMHVHGVASHPDSLRHVLSRFSQRLPTAEHEMVVQAARKETVCLGWAATDPDLLAALMEGCGPLHVLVAGDTPARDTLANLETVAAVRPVTLYRGGFERMAAPFAVPVILPNGIDFEPAMRAVDAEVLKMPVGEARRAYTALSYEYSLAVGHEVDHGSLLAHWANLGPLDRREQPLYRLSLAEHLQASGKPGRAAILNLAVFARTRDPYLLSEVGDACERLAKGLLPGRSLLGVAMHALSLRRYAATGTEAPAWVRIRHARALIRLGRDARALDLLTNVLVRDPASVGLWVRAHAHRLRGLACASTTADWRPDIEEATALFVFAARTLEVGSTLRAASLCEVLEGGSGWRARALSRLREAGAKYELASDSSAPVLLRKQTAVTKHLPRRVCISLLKHW